MYGLFKNSYDYHEWHDLVCVSRNQRSLADRAKDLGDYPLLSGASQEAAEDREDVHYVIELVEEI